MIRPALLFLACTAVPLLAQSKFSVPMNEFLTDWKTSKQFTIAVAEAMPAEMYGFKPTPEQMTFGEQMIHIAASLFNIFAHIKGAKPPVSDVPKEITKAIALDWLNRGFDYAIAALPTFTDEQMMSVTFPIYWPGRTKVTGKDQVLNMFVHVAHHRAQCEVYLRLKGITPPAYVF